MRCTRRTEHAAGEGGRKLEKCVNKQEVASVTRDGISSVHTEGNPSKKAASGQSVTKQEYDLLAQISEKDIYVCAYMDVYIPYFPEEKIQICLCRNKMRKNN